MKRNRSHPEVVGMQRKTEGSGKVPSIKKGKDAASRTRTQRKIVVSSLGHSRIRRLLERTAPLVRKE